MQHNRKLHFLSKDGTTSFKNFNKSSLLTKGSRTGTLNTSTSLEIRGSGNEVEREKYMTFSGRLACGSM